VKILIVGMGSAGQRHARVTRNQFPNSQIDFFRGEHRMGLISPDLKSISDSQDPGNFYGLVEIFDIEKISKKYDLIIIATPVDSHYYYFNLLYKNTQRILIEKPLSNDIHHSDIIFDHAARGAIEILVGYQHFYNPIFQMIKLNFTRFEKIHAISMKYIESLNHMNPFRDMSTHHLSTLKGGGAMLALSHEIDLLLSLAPERISKLSVKEYSSNIDFPVLDSCEIKTRSLIFSKPKINLELSFANRANERSGVITSMKSEIQWDLLQKYLVLRNHKSEKKIFFDFNADDLMRHQLVDFIEGKISRSELLIRLNRAREIVKMSSTHSS
jgi:predicted dehydrogenase